MDEGAVIIMTAESSPKVKAHINRIIFTIVTIGHDGCSGYTVMLNRYSFAIELVMLGRAMLIEECGGYSDKGGTRFNILKICAYTIGTILI